jgi:hypothetical protein
MAEQGYTGLAQVFTDAPATIRRSPGTIWRFAATLYAKEERGHDDSK